MKPAVLISNVNAITEFDLYL